MSCLPAWARGRRSLPLCPHGRDRPAPPFLHHHPPQWRKGRLLPRHLARRFVLARDWTLLVVDPSGPSLPGRTRRSTRRCELRTAMGVAGARSRANARTCRAGLPSAPARSRGPAGARPGLRLWPIVAAVALLTTLVFAAINVWPLASDTYRVGFGALQIIALPCRDCSGCQLNLALTYVTRSFPHSNVPEISCKYMPVVRLYCPYETNLLNS
jgi:hypothetical protein